MLYGSTCRYDTKQDLEAAIETMRKLQKKNQCSTDCRACKKVDFEKKDMHFEILLKLYRSVLWDATKEEIDRAGETVRGKGGKNPN